VDLVEEVLEAFVFGQPCAHLREQWLGDVDGACLAVLFEGQVLSGMKRSAVVASTGGPPAAMGIGGEGGGEDRGGGSQLVEAMLQHAQDEGGMCGNAHEASRIEQKHTGVGRFSGRRAKSEGANKRKKPG
jgi:hypothetical protein